MKWWTSLALRQKVTHIEEERRKEQLAQARAQQDQARARAYRARVQQAQAWAQQDQARAQQDQARAQVTEPPQKRQRKDGRTLLKEVKKQLADSEQHLQAKDKQLEETKEHLRAKDEELEETKEHLRAKDEELEETKEQAQQTQEEIKAELLCGVCKGLFIEPVMLNCAHSFCTFCIRKCREVKNECPLCREPVQYQTRNLVLEKCMEPIVHRLSPDEKATRHREITERAANQDETRETPDRMEVSPAQDMLSPSQDVLYLHASPIDGVYSDSPYVNSPAYNNIPTPQSVSSTESENEEPSRSWRHGA